MNKAIQKTREVDVLIVGAGISGLAAAYTLRKKNKQLRIALLEARERIGGRVWSASLGEGLIGEYGAEWIGVTHKHMRKLAKELNIPLEVHRYVDTGYMTKKLRIDNEGYEAVEEKLSALLDSLKHGDQKKFRSIDRLSWKEFLVQQGFTPSELEIVNDGASAEYGANIDRVTALLPVMEHRESGKNMAMDFHVQGGNTKLMEALVKKIGKENIFLSHEVVTLAQDKKGVAVVCRNGAAWHAEKIIMTLPMPLLTRVKFLPALPQRYTALAKSLKYGNIIKVILVFPKRFWGKENFAQLSGGLNQYVYHTTQSQKGKRGALCIYATGARADKLARMSMEAIWRALRKELSPTMDTQHIAPISMTRHFWKKDKFSRGAYAFYAPLQGERIRQTFGKPFRHVYFSGEYLGEHQGFMEGAAETGIARAHEVLDNLQYHDKAY